MSEHPVVPSGTPPPRNPDQQKHRPTGVWTREMIKFVGQEVTVRFMVGEESHLVTGILRSFHPQGVHIFVDTPTEAVFIRLPQTITRKRKHAEGA